MRLAFGNKADERLIYTYKRMHIISGVFNLPCAVQAGNLGLQVVIMQYRIWRVGQRKGRWLAGKGCRIDPDQSSCAFRGG